MIFSITAVSTAVCQFMGHKVWLGRVKDMALSNVAMWWLATKWRPMFPCSASISKFGPLMAPALGPGG
jgi:hypothetical protein